MQIDVAFDQVMRRNAPYHREQFGLVQLQAELVGARKSPLHVGRSVAGNGDQRLTQAGLQPQLQAHALGRFRHLRQTFQAFCQACPRLAVRQLTQSELARLQPERRRLCPEPSGSIVVRNQLRPYVRGVRSLVGYDIRDPGMQ